jgi:hypothetical protein
MKSVPRRAEFQSLYVITCHTQTWSDPQLPEENQTIIDMRANVSTPKEGKTVLRLRLYNHDGDSLTGSTVVTLSDCSVFSSKAWTCKDPDSEMYSTLEDETLSIVTPPNTSGITGVNMTLKRVHP